MTDKKTSLTGIVLDEQIEYTLSDISRSCSVRREAIVALVAEGVLIPSRRDGNGYRFAGSSVKRARKAIRLQKELELNLPGVALVLELLDELERLRGRLQEYERRSRP